MDKRFYLTEDEKRRILGLHQSSIKKNKINEADVTSIQQQILDLGGYVGKLGADGKLGPDTLTAVYNYLSKMNPIGSKLTAFKGPGSVDGSEETFDSPVNANTATTTPTTATTTSSTATTTPTTATTTNTAAAPTSQNPDIMADLKSASQIRQEFRQGKRDKNKAQRQYNQMVNKYNRLKDKMSPQDNTAYLQAINQLKTQIG
jgi:peptidoglycan hydrolase-like protein with peptidoglycan-binding domain